MITSTKSKRVTGVINCWKTYAALALVGLLASFCGAADKVAPPPPRLTFAEELERKIAVVQRETPEESVQMLLQDHFMEFRFRRTASSNLEWESMRRDLEREPRVAKLLDLARNGSEEQRASLLTETKKMCRHFIEDSPLMPESRYDLSPTALHPGGALAYPLLLSVLDEKVETLPLLVKMLARNQKACRERRAEDSEGHEGVGDEKVKETYVVTEFGQVAAYACAELLSKCLRTPALRSALSSGQTQILDEFAEYGRVFTKAFMFFDEKKIFHFARDFARAANR